MTWQSGEFPAEGRNPIEYGCEKRLNVKLARASIK
jgi:hypothetical protein